MTCVTSVTVSPSNFALNVGESKYLSATVYPTDASCKCVTWSSSNTKVVSVNATTGQVLAISKGTATIYATAQDGSCVLDRCTVTVYIPVSSVSISPKSTNMYIGDRISLNTTVYPNNATYKLCNYSSSDTSVATVNNLGDVTATAKNYIRSYPLKVKNMGHSIHTKRFMIVHVTNTLPIGILNFLDTTGECPTLIRQQNSINS